MVHPKSPAVRPVLTVDVPLLGRRERDVPMFEIDSNCRMTFQ